MAQIQPLNLCIPKLLPAASPSKFMEDRTCNKLDIANKADLLQKL